MGNTKSKMDARKNAIHGEIVNRFRPKLIATCKSPSCVLDRLYSKNIFDIYFKIVLSNVRIVQVIDALCTRGIAEGEGTTSFNRLIEVLQATDNENVANVLKSIAVQTTEIPEVLPSDRSMNEFIFVWPCDKESKLLQETYRRKDVYSMIAPVRGRCIVISNKVFSNRHTFSERHGTEKDENALEELFTQLYFNVIIHRNKTAQEMLQILKQEGKCKDHEDAKCFICVICSHGNKRGIFGVDGEPISPDQVEQCFDGQNCPALVGKPKLFFFQACQGGESDVGVDVQSEDSGPDLCNLAYNMTPEAKIKSDSAVGYKRKVPVKSDIVVASATHPGYVSWRNEEYGSWFIQAVVYVFSRFAAERHILDLLTLVNRLVANIGIATGDGQMPCMQATRCYTSLQKDLFFFPNILKMADKKE